MLEHEKLQDKKLLEDRRREAEVDTSLEAEILRLRLRLTEDARRKAGPATVVPRLVELSQQDYERPRLADAARQDAIREAERQAEPLPLTLIIPAGRPNWFQGVPGAYVNWTAGGWMFVNGRWVDPPNGWLTRANLGGIRYQHPAPTLAPPVYQGNWIWNHHNMNWVHLVDPTENPSPDWPNWWQGPPEVNWTAGGWMFVNGQWQAGVHYEHPAPTLPPPLEPGDWVWNHNNGRWDRWVEQAGRRRRR